MAECYTAVLSGGVTFILAWSIGSILGALITNWFDNREIRNERERLKELLAAGEAERDRYRQSADL